MPESQLIQDFERARMRGVPLIAIETIDSAATLRQITAKYDTKEKSVPIIKWDVARGMDGLTKKGAEALAANPAIGKLMPADPPYEFIKAAMDFPVDTIFVIVNGHQFMGNGSLDHAAFAQALWNLRDPYKMGGQKRTAVLTAPAVHLPEEVRQDFIILEDPLPNAEELWAIAEKLYKLTKVPLPNEEEKDRIIQTGKGLSVFGWEQTVALSLKSSGIDMERLWSQKRKQTEQTVGLSIYQGTETYEDVRGVSTLKQFLGDYMTGKTRPTELVFLDEVEKLFAGISGDNTGASQEQHGEFLRWTQDNKIPGIMLVGHPGCSKSFISKATAGEFNVPLVELNISALKGSLLGQTGEQTRMAFKQILAIGRPLIIATSNSLGILPPELKRRFRLGTWFSDLPDATERAAVWDLYMKKYSIINQALPNDEGWTPAEIETCCELAWNLNRSLLDASNFVVPVSKSDPEKVENLRRIAHNRFNSVSHPGTYKYNKLEWMVEQEKDRDIVLGIDKKSVGQA